MKSNLIVCMTPLQALIAERIVENTKGEDYDLLYITYYNFEKNMYYYDKIKNRFVKSKIIFLNKGFISFFSFVLKSIFSKDVKYDSIYIATLHDKYCQFIAAKFYYKTLKTFDDGFGNIYPSSVFYAEEKENTLKYILLNKFSLRYSINKIKENTEEHVTIYKNINNISNKINYVPIYKDGDVVLVNNGKKISFFLGQPLFDFNPMYNSDYMNRLLRKINVDFYVPHPAEKYSISTEFKQVETKLVFEDYLKKIILNNPVENVTVYSFFSSALFNLKDIKGVNVVSIYNEDLINDFSDVYNFIKFSNLKMLEIL